MDYSKSYNTLQYQHEILYARLTIREHYLETVIKDVYENISQVLALVRVQLGVLQLDSSIQEKKKADVPGELIGAAIRDLRNMCRSFYPDISLDTPAKINKVIASVVYHIYPGLAPEFNEPYAMQPVTGSNSFMLPSLVLDILKLIKKDRQQLVEIKTVYRGRYAAVFILYKGDTVNFKQKKHDTSLPPDKRARLAGGSLEIKKINGSVIRIKLVIPIN